MCKETDNLDLEFHNYIMMQMNIYMQAITVLPAWLWKQSELLLSPQKDETFVFCEHYVVTQYMKDLLKI